MSSRRYQYILKTSWQDVLKTSSRFIIKLIVLINTSSRYLQVVFKTYSTRFRDALRIIYRKIYLRLSTTIIYRLSTIIYRKICRQHFWEICGKGTNFSRVNSLNLLKLLTASTNKDVLVKVGYQKRCYCLSK